MFVNIYQVGTPACHGLVQSPKVQSKSFFFTFMLRQDGEKQQRVYKQRLLKTFRTDNLD